MTRKINLHGTSLTLAAGALSLVGGMAHAQTFTSNVIIQGSLCVGVDCVTGESFGFDTIKLKENNLRIKFQDTSTSASFPSNDWQIRINDSSNGGGNYYAVEDVTGGRTPFLIEAGARANALYVEADGDVGIGTANPAVDLEIVTGNTPTLRLQQDGSSGFTPQTFDVAANEANFFVRDATNGSQLPFKIKPGADSDSLFVAANNNIGLGTGSPDGPLHIRNNSVYITLDDADNNDKWFITHEATDDGNLELTSELNGSGTYTVAFDLSPAGALTIGGALTENSDKNNKMAIEEIDTGEILAKVAALPVSTWTYKSDAEDGIRHIGPMAQDFYALFGTGASERGISTLDTSGVALAAIQELIARIDDQQSEIKALKAVLAEF